MQDFTQVAWLEWRTRIPSRTPDEYGRIAAQPTPDDFDIHPPAWFKKEELGRSWGHAPSIETTQQTLAVKNRRALTLLASSEEGAPIRVTYPRDFQYPRRSTHDPRGSRREPRAAHQSADAEPGASLSHSKPRAA